MGFLSSYGDIMKRTRNAHSSLHRKSIRFERLANPSTTEAFFAVIYGLSTHGVDLYKIDANHVTLPILFQGEPVADILINRRCANTYDMQHCHVDIIYYDYAELLLNEEAIYDAIDDGARNVFDAVKWVEDSLEQEILVEGCEVESNRDIDRLIANIQSIKLQMESDLLSIDDFMKQYKYRQTKPEARKRLVRNASKNKDGKRP